MKIVPGTTTFTSWKIRFQKILVCYTGQNLDKNTMTTLCFSFFHSFLNYGNIAWGSTTKSKLRKIASQQRQVVNAIPKNHNQEITNSRKFMEENGILNVYKLNLYQVLNV